MISARVVVGCAVLMFTATALVGCGLAPPDAEAAASVAREFVGAVEESDGAAACDLLAPRAQEALAEEAHSPCAEAVLEPDVIDALPAPDAALDEEPLAYGRQAQVHLGGDVLFLVLDGEGWVVRAAGCTPRPDQPYDCTIEGS
jgi:hypothetical protein